MMYQNTFRHSQNLQKLFGPVVLLVGLVVWSLGSLGSTSNIGISSLQGEAAMRSLKGQGLYDSLREAMVAARYNINEDSEQDGIWRGVNKAHGLREKFTPEGAQVEVVGAGGKSHRMGLKLRGIGYGKRKAAMGDGSLKGQKNRIEIKRSMESGVLTEWYMNTESGLEHGFTLSAPPGKRTGEERLRLVMAIEGDLLASDGGAGREIGFKTPSGEAVLRYEKLAVDDVRGRKLEAAMGVAAGELWIEVDDRNAVYPVTVDPTIVQQAYLKASNTDAGDGFGSVAVSGDTVVVGASLEDSNATGVNGDQSDNSALGSGAAYVFVRDGMTWSQQAYLKASNTGADDGFGLFVAVSGDTIIVAAPREDSSATGVNGDQSDNTAPDSGAAYIFVRNGGVWSQQAYLKASNTESGDSFGVGIAISGDTVIVGASLEDSSATGVNGDQSDNSAFDSGASYIFVRNGAIWSQQAYLKASNTDPIDVFGHSVAVSGDTAVVATPFEDSNATGVNGNQANNSAPTSGAAYVFVRSAGVWSQQAYLKASNTEAGDFLGNSVAVSGDTLVVGAHFESSNATGINGDQNNNSRPISGAAYVFVRTATTWSQQAYLKASNTGQSDQFGVSVAVFGDAIVVGAPGEDSAATGINGDQSDNSSSGSGAAYVFVRNGVRWNQQAYLKASNTEPADDQIIIGDLFGASVTISGDTVVVGARREDSNAIGVNGNQNNNLANDSGADYIFIDPCPYNITPATRHFSAAGGTGTVGVTVNAGCAWTGVSNVDWVQVTAGADGSGNGTVSFHVDANTGVARQGTITIAGKTFTAKQGANFADVSPDNFFYEFIGKVSAAGITTGCGTDAQGDPIYCPGDPVMREQMAAFMMRALGEFNPPVPASQRFSDVPPNNFFYPFIDQIAVLGITTGCNPPQLTQYCPTRFVTREQMSAFVLRALGEFNPPVPTSQRFLDVPPENFFYPFIDRMAALGITTGCNPPTLDQYCPASVVTREQLAAFLVRALGL